MFVYGMARQAHGPDEGVNFELQGVPALESRGPLGFKKSNDAPSPVLNTILCAQAQQGVEFLQRQ